MRVHATGAAAIAALASTPRRESRGGFTVDAREPSRASTQATGPRAVAGIDALVALQSVEDATERRRRVVKHGRSALDALEELKLSLLAGELDSAAVARLQALSGTLGETTGDHRLDSLIAEIGLRAAVEVAKFSRR